jgi:hypothetical protein
MYSGMMGVHYLMKMKVVPNLALMFLTYEVILEAMARWLHYQQQKCYNSDGKKIRWLALTRFALQLWSMN